MTMTFGAKLKHARQEKGLTQMQLADLIGVSKSTLANYETDNREPDMFKIKKILSVLDISSDYILGVEKQSSPSKDEEENVDEIAKALYEWLIHTGFLKEGQNLTEQQVKGLHGLSDILMALFGEEFK